MGLIYLDSCILIYLVEEHGLYSAAARQALAEVADSPLRISPLVKHECLVKPLRVADGGLVRRFQSYFDQAVSLEMSEQVFLEGARIRAQFGLKTPDALHLACARVHGCSALWTNDTRISAAGGDLVRAIGG